jgi:hypothetical protein
MKVLNTKVADWCDGALARMATTREKVPGMHGLRWRLKPPLGTLTDCVPPHRDVVEVVQEVDSERVDSTCKRRRVNKFEHTGVQDVP